MEQLEAKETAHSAVIEQLEEDLRVSQVKGIGNAARFNGGGGVIWGILSLSYFI